MIGTIGSLVQGITKYRQWLVATSIYIIACSSTSVLLGIFLGLIGYLVQHLVGNSFVRAVSEYGKVLVGVVAIAYAFSDIGVIRLPRPRALHAVPVSWWRKWRPYGASIAYGAALGVGITTEVQFGAFYVLCLWCITQGNIAYGALLIGTYGVSRSVTILPASWIVYKQSTDSIQAFNKLLDARGAAKFIMAIGLILFGVLVLSDVVL
jgi:hypothetical protein